MKTYIVIIFLEYIFSLIFTREFIVACARVGGANTTPFMAAHFAKQNTKFGGGGKRGRAKIPSPQPPSFLPARAFQFCARSAQSFGVLLKKCSNFVQKTPQIETSEPNTGTPPLARGGVESSNLSLSAPKKVTPIARHFSFSWHTYEKTTPASEERHRASSS